jgi:oligogalacturonide transport system substrate-binding protein
MCDSLKKVILTCVVFSAALITSCFSGSNTQETEPDESLDECTLRFSWWGGDDRHEATLKAIELWNEKQPEIVIQPEYGGWDGWTEKIITQINSGTAPDIMQINYDWLVNLSDSFYDLNRLTGNLDLSGYTDDILSFGETDGRLSAITVSISGRGLFYNSAVYESVGAEYPTTWAELIELGEKFSSEDVYPLDLDIQSGSTAWYLAVVYVQQLTGKEFISMDGELGFTEEDIETALNFYKTLETNHVIRTVKTRTDEDGNAALYQSSEFIDGKVAGVLEWGSAVGKYESALDTGTLECGPFLCDSDGNSGGWMIKPSLMYAVNKYTEYPDESAAFIDFLLNDGECAEILGTTRGIPSSSYALSQLEESGLLTGLAYENSVMLEELDTITVSPYMELSRMKEIYNTAIEQISYNTSDIPFAAQQMYDSIVEYLGSFGK